MARRSDGRTSRTPPTHTGPPRKPNPAASGGRASAVRIIGGAWRRRLIPVPESPGLRPSLDRVRETLFNWLQPVTSGAACLDLFAGTGALGLEAASRGAAAVTLVDNAPRLVRNLESLRDRFAPDRIRVVHANAHEFLLEPSGPYDIVFLDPPFGAGLLEDCLARLEKGTLLKPGARIYLEHSVNRDPLHLPESWALERSARAGEVGYGLARVL